MPSQNLLSLPGYELAKANGFDLHRTSGNKAIADYVTDDAIHLTATADELELSFVHGLLIVSTAKFGYHADFDLFMRKTREAKEKLEAG